MHGLGNDYIYIDCLNAAPENPETLAVEMSDRHTGIGSDGLILILPSEMADFRMRMFNSDGSEGKMCGNASRCIGKYVYDNHLTDKRTVTLETLSGIRTLELHTAHEEVTEVTVDMGEPETQASFVPVIAETETLINAPVETSQGIKNITAVSMGNPHGVIFVDSLDDVDVHALGRELELHPMWPDRANIEFVEIISNNHIRMRVWERGSGETMACGTGACAAAVAAALNGYTGRDVKVSLLGGDLYIRWKPDGHILMRGPAETVFTGEYRRHKILTSK